MFDLIADVASSFLGGIFGDDDDDRKATVEPSTLSSQAKQDVDILFDDAARDSFKVLIDSMGNWSEADRTFFEDVYRPFQESIITANQELIPLLAQNANLSLEQSIKDLTSSENLKAMFNSSITEMGANISDVASRLNTELQNLPTVEERVGQAVTNVEIQFGKAGKELRDRLKSQGVNVSQATERAMAIEKAAAKAGAAGQAAEAARRERMDALTAGAGVFSDIQTSQSGQLTDQQKMTQEGVGLTTDIGDVQELTGTTDATKLAVEGSGNLGLQTIGTEQKDTSIDITEKGVTEGKFPGLPGDINDTTLDNLQTIISEEIAKGIAGLDLGTNTQAFDDGPEGDRFDGPGAGAGDRAAGADAGSGNTSGGRGGDKETESDATGSGGQGGV